MENKPISQHIFILALCAIVLSCAQEKPKETTIVKTDENPVSKYENNRVTVNDSAQVYVDSIEQFGALFSDAIGYSGTKPKVYSWFEKLMETASDDELIQLTEHRSPAIRGYSFWALVKKESPEAKEILLKHADDSAQVERASGCNIGYTETVIEFYTNLVNTVIISEDGSQRRVGEFMDVIKEEE